MQNNLFSRKIRGRSEPPAATIGGTAAPGPVIHPYSFPISAEVHRIKWEFCVFQWEKGGGLATRWCPCLPGSPKRSFKLGCRGASPIPSPEGMGHPLEGTCKSVYPNIACAYSDLSPQNQRLEACRALEDKFLPLVGAYLCPKQEFIVNLDGCC